MEVGAHLLDLSLGSQAGAVASQPNCPSGQNTTSGECCKQCPPGEGVVTLCGAKQTECAPCLDSEYQEILFFSPK